MPRKRGKSFWRVFRMWPAEGDWFVVVMAYRSPDNHVTMMERVVGFADAKSSLHARHVRPLLAKGGALLDLPEELCDWLVVRGEDACPTGITWAALYRAANPRPALLRDVTRLLKEGRHRQGEQQAGEGV